MRKGRWHTFRMLQGRSREGGTEKDQMVQRPSAIHDQAEATVVGAEEDRVRGAVVVVDRRGGITFSRGGVNDIN